jgi:hypothetical protein
MTALLEDTYGRAADVGRRDRVALVRAGLTERAREAGLVGSAQAGEQARGGALLVLCGWTFFLVAGAAFAKFSDNWLAGTPVSDRWLASTSYDAVLVAGTAGCVLVLAAALTVVPAFVRLLRRGRWPDVGRAVWRAVAAGALALALGGVALAWAHRLGAHARNGGNQLYGALLLIVGLVAVVALVCATAAAIRFGRRADLSVPTLRALGAASLGVSLLMVVQFAGFVTWWVFEILRAPAVLQNGIGSGLPFASTVLPPTLLAAGLLQVLGLGLAAWGALRVARPVLRWGAAS